MRAPGATIARGLVGFGLRFAALAVLVPRASTEDVAQRIAALRGGDARAAQEAARELARLEPEAAPEIVALCAGRDAALGPLSAPEREFLLASLRAWPADVAVPALVDALPGEAVLDERLSLLALLGEVGGRQAIPCVAALCADLPDLEQAHPRLRDEVVRTLARALGRDRRAYPELERLLDKGEPRAEFLEHAAAALGNAERGAGLASLERLLGRDARLDAAVLAALGRLRPFDDPGVLVRAVRTLRRHLSAPDAELRRQAALALGELGDGEAVADLIALVHDADGSVRRCACLALGRISGLDARVPPETWPRWHEEELAWLEHEAQDLCLDLASSEPARVQAALRVLSMHPLGRSLVAEDVQALLEHADPAIAVAACGTLVKLDDVSAFAVLVEALEDERPPVQAAAASALRSLTGADLGPDPEAWHAWLAPDLP